MGEQASPEPWNLTVDHNGSRLYDDNMDLVAEFENPQAANRAFLAVNACEGISTDALEDGAVLELREALEMASEELLDRELDKPIWPFIHAALEKTQGLVEANSS